MKSIKQIMLMLICFLFCSTCIAQLTTKKKEGIACCVDIQLKKEGTTEFIPVLLKGDGNYVSDSVCISVSNDVLIIKDKVCKVDLSKIDSIKKWIELAEISKLKVYNLKSKDKNYFLLSSKIVGATGIAINFYQWLIIDATNFNVISANLMSLSDDARMFFSQGGKLNIIIFDFGDDFFRKKRDWDNPPIKVTKYNVQSGILKMVSQKDTLCKCH